MHGWWGHTCAVFVCSVGAWKNHAPSALYLHLYCICIVFVLYLWRHRCGVFAGSVGVGTINAPAASPQIPILPSSSPLPSSLPNYLLNCPQHRRLATRAWNNALAKFSNLLTVSRSVWPIPFNSFHLPGSSKCVWNTFFVWNTTNCYQTFETQHLGLIHKQLVVSPESATAAGLIALQLAKPEQKFTKWQMIDGQLQLPISAGCYLREASVYENGWIFSYWKGAVISKEMRNQLQHRDQQSVNWRWHMSTTHQRACCVRESTQFNTFVVPPCALLLAPSTWANQQKWVVANDHKVLESGKCYLRPACIKSICCCCGQLLHFDTWGPRSA